MRKGVVFLDFEYNHTAERDLNLVCCSTTVFLEDGGNEDRDWWLLNDSLAHIELAQYLESHKNKTFFSWSVEAEARSMLALGLDVISYEFIDLFLDYRMLKNHNHDLQHGLQLIDGKIKRTYPFGEKGKDNLAAATYKLLKLIIDTDHKTEMRDIIIRGNPEEIEANKKSIMDYCRSDVVNLPKLRNAISAYYPKVIPKDKLPYLAVEAKRRGNYAARTAVMLELGYPVNVEWLHNFASNVPQVLETCQRDINSQFPNNPPFRWNKKEQRFSMNTKTVKEWIVSKHGDDWEKTDKKDISLALDAFTKKYNYSHDYPEGNLGAQMVRFLKLKQAMNGFNIKAEKNIFHSLGTDGRIRCYLNPYGAQSSRTQPASTSFIFLKPAWVRSMVQPKPGKAIGDYDWSSEEFFLSALVSKDKKMIEAYKSGDVYLAFAKMIGMVPQTATKQSHKYERDVCKSLVLGLSYLMTEYGLAHKLTEDTGRVWTEEEALELVEQFEETFCDFAEWRAEQIATYRDEGHIKLPCGWYMFGDNDNFRSVGNVPIQGLGACIMRKAVELAQDAGLQVIFTLHDAIYIEYDSWDFAALDTLKKCMDEAFLFYFDGEMREHAKSIRVDGNTWSLDYEDGEIVTPAGDKVTCSKIFVDPRATKEYELYKQYMEKGTGEELLA